MNYYERHLGDYAKDTSHLSQAEHGAYNLIIDYYYATETGLERKNIYRVGKAKKKTERDAVDFVIAEFFYLENGVYRKRRIEEEIAKAQVKIRAAQENGKKGGRKKKPLSETQSKPNGLDDEKPTGLDSLYPEKTQPLSSPDTRHQTPVKELQAAATHSTGSPVVEIPMIATEVLARQNQDRDPITTRAIELAVLLRKRGAALTGSDPFVRKWAESGVTDALALTSLEKAQANRAAACSPQPINSGYLNSIIFGTETAVSEGAKGKHKPENFDAKNYGEGVHSL